MREIKGEELRELLHRQAKAVSDEALEAGRVSAEHVEALGRLARLVEICDGVQPPPRKRWPVIAVLGGTLLLVSILLFARVSETEIELDLAVSEVSFVLSNPQVLADVMRLSALGVSGLQEIRLPRSRDRSAQNLNASGGTDSAIRLSVESDGERKGTVTLVALKAPAGTRVWVRSTDVPHQYRLSLKASSLDFRADVNGPVRVGSLGAPAEIIDFVSPKSILLRPGSNEVDFDLTVPAASKGTFSPQLSTKGLSLFRIDEFVDADRSLVRRISTIMSGTLYFESLNGQERTLRPGEGIHFKGSEGDLRTLQLRDGYIALKFHGRVVGMSTGAGESRTSLMPTYLEWLKARHGLSLLWGTTLYLFGLILGILRWWRISV